jgi:hypothetical protein
MGFGDNKQPAAKGLSFGAGPSVAPVGGDDASMRSAFRVIPPPAAGPQVAQPKPVDPALPKKAGGKGAILAAVGIGLVALIAVGAVLASRPSSSPAPQPAPVVQAAPQAQPLPASQINGPQIGTFGAIREESRVGGPLLGFWAQSASFASNQQVISESGDGLTQQSSQQSGWQIVGITHQNASIARLGIRLGDIMTTYQAGSLPTVQLGIDNPDAIVRCHAQTQPLDRVVITFFRPGVGLMTASGPLGYTSSAADLTPGVAP